MKLIQPADPEKLKLPKPWEGQKLVCEHCRCEFELERDDAVQQKVKLGDFGSIQATSFLVPCPECRALVVKTNTLFISYL